MMRPDHYALFMMAMLAGAAAIMVTLGLKLGLAFHRYIMIYEAF
jgi:hypothetical protein